MTSHAEESGRGSIDALSGLRAFFGGIGFVLSTPSVWGWSLVPVGFMALLSFGLCGLSWWGAWEASKALVGEENLGTWTLTVLFGLLGVMLAVLVALTLAQPCSGFALEAICRAQEREMVGRASPAIPYWASLFRNLKVIVATLVLGGGIMLALFVIELLVPPAAAVTVPLKFLVGGWLMAWNFLDYPLGLRGMGFRDSLRWVSRHFGAVTVFGLTWWSLVLFPGAVLLLLPMGVAGAARLVVEADGVEHLVGPFRQQRRPRLPC
jgi:CysZ protein